MRARNIKPGFFNNELLGTADPFVHLLFSGLWLLADRAGRLEDRPLRIKADIFPYREGINVDDILTELARLNFITRYEVDGKKFIQVEFFTKHQTPHKTEKLSIIPPKPLIKEASSASTVNAEIITESLPSDSLIHPFTDLLIPEDTVEVDRNESFDSPIDFKKNLFTDGLKLIGGNSKRSLLGKWLRDYGEANVLTAFLACQRNSAVDPIPYIEKILKETKNATTIGNNKSKPYADKPTWVSEGQRLADKYREDAEREEQAAISRDAEPSLRLTEAIRQDAG